MPGGNIFIPKMFQGFPEIKEALISNRMQAGFLVAPMAMALRSQGVPIKIVYLGHRYGSAGVVRKDGPIRTPADLRGRVIAIPNRFSDERLMAGLVLRTHGLSEKDVRLVEMAPPDVASALAAGAIDMFVMGEPYPSQAEMGGYGRVLFFAKDVWPDYMSCVLVVRQDVIDRRPEAVQLLVDGIAASGMWLDEGTPHREYAAEFVGRYYFRQAPALLRWALTNPVDRVMYSPLTPLAKDFDMVNRLMVEAGLLRRPLAFSDYVDVRFAEQAHAVRAWDFQPGDAR